MGKRLLCLLLAALAGVAFWAAFPNLAIWPLGLVGTGLLWYALTAISARRTDTPVGIYADQLGVRPGWSALAGLLAGFTFFGPHVWWASVATALVPWIALVLLQAAFWGVLGLFWAWTLRIPWVTATPWRQALAFAVLFTGVEQWRSSIPFGGFPWGRLAWSVVWAAPGRIAWLGGSVLVTFVLVWAASLVAVTICQAFRSRNKHGVPNVDPNIANTDDVDIATSPNLLGHPDAASIGDAPSGSVTPIITSVSGPPDVSSRFRVTPVLRVAIAALGALLLLTLPLFLPLPHDDAAAPLPQWRSAPADIDRTSWVDAGTGTAQNGVIQVGIVQGNVFNPGLPGPENADAVFQSHLDATQLLIDDDFTRQATNSAVGEEVFPVGYDVIVWPENAAAWDPVRWPVIGNVLDVYARQIGATILIGSMEYPETGGRYNVMLLWEAGQGVIARYAKQIPAPFGEYIPFRTFARMITDQVDRLPIDMLAADNPPVVDWYVPRLSQQVRMGLGICFEVAYDHVFIDAVRRGAEFIVVPTNNASFGWTAQSDQQLQMTAMQAITTGRAAVQISTVGVSGVFTPNGRIVAVTNLWEQDRISALMPLRTSLTPAVRLGQAPANLALTLGVLLPLIGLIWDIRQRRLTRPEITEQVATKQSQSERSAALSAMGIG